MSLSSIQKTFSATLPWDKIDQHLGDSHTIKLEHFVGSTPALFLAQLSRRFNNVICVFPDYESARFLKSDLDALESPNSFLFPPSGQKPYDDQQITDNALSIQRSEVLEQIQELEQSLTVTSVDALVEKIISPDQFAASTLQVSVSDTIEPETLREELVDQNYNSVKFVNQPGEFARRGGIMDVFPFSGDYPIRIEFFGDEVDSIREFDPDSQRSISHQQNVRFVPDVTAINTGSRQQLLHYLGDDTVVALFDTSLIFAKFEEQFTNAEEHYSDIDDTENTEPPSERYVSLSSFKSSIKGKPQIGFGPFSTDAEPDWSYRLDASPNPISTVASNC